VVSFFAVLTEVSFFLFAIPSCEISTSGVVTLDAIGVFAIFLNGDFALDRVKQLNVIWLVDFVNVLILTFESLLFHHID
jgi:hypothetical protein